MPLKRKRNQALIGWSNVLKSRSAKSLLALLALCLLSLGIQLIGDQVTAPPADMICGNELGPTVFSDPDGPGPLPAGEPRIEGALVVDFADGTTLEQIQEFNQEFDVKARYNSIHSLSSALTVVEVPEGSMPEWLNRFSAHPLVTAVSPNYVYTVCEEPSSGFPNDPEYKYQWHMQQINTEDAWRWSSGQGAVLAVIDTGVAYKDHGDYFRLVEDLDKTAFVEGYDFVNRRKEALDDHCHGTHVAGTMGQSTNNGKGVTGVAFGSTLMPIKVLSGGGSGTLSGVADGIRFAADNGCAVMNLSLGGSSPAKVLDQAVAHAVKQGTVVVCAAGNSSSSRPGYPAGCEGAISVSATDFEEQLSWYSNHGPSIDIAAPGGDARSDKNGDGMPDGVYQNTIVPGKPLESGYFNFQGTSMAAPHVAGVFGLAASLGVTDRTALEALVMRNTRPQPEGSKEGYGAGIVDAGAVAHEAGYVHGKYKLFFALGCALLAFAVMLRRGNLFGVILMGPGILIGACGLLFLVPAFGLNTAPLNAYLTTGFPAWDLLCFGTGAHGSPFTHSFLAPLLVSIVFMLSRLLRPIAAGFAAGVGGHLIFVWQFHTVRMDWLTPDLQSLWLVSNALVCIALAAVVAAKR